MNGFVIARVSALVGLVVMGVTFFVYEPNIPNPIAQRQKAGLKSAATQVEVRGDIPAGWWQAAQVIRSWRPRGDREQVLTSWVGTLSDEVRERWCAEGLVRARMGMQTFRRWGDGSMVGSSDGDAVAAISQFELAIGALEDWRAAHSGEDELFHLYTLGLSYRAVGRLEESGGVLEEWWAAIDRESAGLEMYWWVHQMSHLGGAFESAGRGGEAGDVYYGIARQGVDEGYAGNNRFGSGQNVGGSRGGTVDRPAEVVERLLALGDAARAREVARWGYGESGKRLEIWAWRDVARELDRGGEREAAVELWRELLDRYLEVGEAGRDGAWWYAIAQMRALLGEEDAAVEALGMALRIVDDGEGLGWSIVRSDSDLEGVRDHPGYAALGAEFGGEVDIR